MYEIIQYSTIIGRAHSYKGMSYARYCVTSRAKTLSDNKLNNFSDTHFVY